ALVRHIVGPERLRGFAIRIDGITVTLLIVFAVGIMDGVTARLLASPADTARVTALTFGGYLGLMLASAAAFRIIGPDRDRRTVLGAGFISGCRNLAIIVAVLPADADPDIALFFALGQFPIYIMPAVLRPVFRRLLGGGVLK
ncbi:MAG: hypothetical protein O2944_11335, partial [Proteobacteria bacterium]|nr:hypothetical protein [Pseudomonadota bacterium]